MRDADRRLDFLLAGLCAAAFCVLHLAHRSAHAVHPDAADMLYPVVGLLRQDPVLLSRSVNLHVLGLSVPVWFHPYHGPYEGYLSLPFLLAFGATSLAAYVRSTFFGALAVLGVYALALRLHRSRAVAGLAAFLFAASSGFVLASRFGINAGTSVVPMTLFALWFLAGWAENGRARDLVAGCCLLGLACATRAWCAGLLPAGVSLAVFYRRALPRVDRPLALRCAAAFGVWFLPMLLGNLLDGWQTLSFFQNTAGAPLLRGFSWADAASERVHGLKQVLDGTRWIGLFTEDRVLPAGTAMPLLAGLALAGALALGRRSARHLAPAAVFSVFFLCSLASPTNRVPNHLYPVVPLLYIGAAAAPLLARAGRARKAAWAAVLALSAWTLAGDARVLRWFWGEVEATGGRGAETALAVEDLSRWLAEPGRGAPIVASPANFTGSVLYLSAGRAAPESPYWGADPAVPLAPAWWETALRRPGAVFVFDLDPESRRPSLAFMAATARKEGRRLELLRSFARRDGVTVFEAYAVR